MSPFCAICAADIHGTPARQPLGKGGATVNVCTACDDEHPRSGRYGFSDGGSSRSIGDGNIRMGSGGGPALKRGGK